jgi:SAM-dependent methyltransferase
MTRSPAELEQTARFEQSYVNAQTDVMLSIERRVCGCDYGGNSWTTREEAEGIATLLALRPGVHYLDLGAGSGWPGLYLAKTSGCDLTLVDLPLSGLQIAAARARDDRLSGACGVTCGDATGLPFDDACFDAISHSDLLCCLQQKRAVLEECRRVLRGNGRMVFTVISLAPGLDPAQRESTRATAPEFVESDKDYGTLLTQTGWILIDRQDISDAYAASSRLQLKAMSENRDAVIDVIGAAEFDNRLARYGSRIRAIDEGRMLREMFVASVA